MKHQVRRVAGGGGPTRLGEMIWTGPEESGGAAGSLWRRLDMEGLARRVIETARRATAEQAMRRLQQAIRRQDAAGEGMAAGLAGPDGRIERDLADGGRGPEKAGGPAKEGG